MIDIQNCKFSYQCSKTWESLIEIKHDKIKYCDVCDRGVHFCENDAELNQAIEKGWCVAINIEPEQRINSSFIVGNLEPGSYSVTSDSK
jgi:hypothetical protein